MAHGQQTVFNVPSGDVLERGKVYAEVDTNLHPSPFSFAATPRIVSGIGRGIEVGINLSGLSAPGEVDGTLSAAVKYRAYSRKQLSVVLGDTFTVHPGAPHPLGNYVYAMAFATWRSNTRFGFGPYHFSPGVVERAQKAGAQMTFEQPFSKRITLAADWLTGQHSSAYVTAGAVWKLSQQVTVYAAYQFGNSGITRGNHGFEFELGWNLN